MAKSSERDDKTQKQSKNEGLGSLLWCDVFDFVSTFLKNFEVATDKKQIY